MPKDHIKCNIDKILSQTNSNGRLDFSPHVERAHNTGDFGDYTERKNEK